MLVGEDACVSVYGEPYRSVRESPKAAGGKVWQRIRAVFKCGCRGGQLGSGNRKSGGGHAWFLYEYCRIFIHNGPTSQRFFPLAPLLA